MVELQEAALGTAAAIVRYEGALAAVALPDLPLNHSRDVTRACARDRCDESVRP
jgi:hypothetical protein